MRQLTSVDAKRMAAIHAESFERPWDALDMATHTQRDMCLGVEQGDGISAFIIISFAVDQAEILTIATAKSARRQGQAKKLMDGALAELEARGATELFLEVAEDNVAAISLYKAAGFQPIGRRPGYYRREAGRMAAITFSKKL